MLPWIPTQQLCKVGVICIDPGFEAGMAVVSLDEQPPKIVYVDALQMKKQAKKKKILVADDDFQRSAGIWRWWDDVYQHIGQLVAVCAETGAGGQSAAAVKVMSYSKAMAGAFALAKGVPFLTVSPQAVKKASTGRNNASKEQVWTAMMKKHPHLHWGRFPKYLLDEAADACAVWEACKNATEIQMAVKFMEMHR